MDLAVAIINYNTRQWLCRCLDSLISTVSPEDLEILVIDNASSDGSDALVRERFQRHVRLLSHATNLGFARAVNRALRQTATRYLLVLNADIEITPGAIQSLYDFMERSPLAGIAGGRLVDEQGRLQPSCRRFYTPSALLLRRTPLGRLFPEHPALRRHLMLDWDHRETRPVEWLQGACLMLRREAVQRIGPMDERFFLYFEDVDLCRRMAEGGWRVVYVPQAIFLHHYRRGSHGRLLSPEKYHHLRSALRYWAKWHPVLRSAAAPSLCSRLQKLLHEDKDLPTRRA